MLRKLTSELILNLSKSLGMKHHLFFYFQAILNLPYGIFLMFSPGAVLVSHFTGPWEMTGGLDFIARAYGSLLAAVGTTALVKALGKSNLDGNVLYIRIEKVKE